MAASAEQTTSALAACRDVVAAPDRVKNRNESSFKRGSGSLVFAVRELSELEVFGAVLLYCRLELHAAGPLAFVLAPSL